MMLIHLKILKIVNIGVVMLVDCKWNVRTVHFTKKNNS